VESSEPRSNRVESLAKTRELVSSLLTPMTALES
jgi:hypothetical protein